MRNELNFQKIFLNEKRGTGEKRKTIFGKKISLFEINTNILRKPTQGKSTL